MDFVPIVKPIGGYCNLRCGYCYFRQKEQRNLVSLIMKSVELKNMIDMTCCEQDVVEFVWHGGEPLLAGKNFYQEAIDYQIIWADKGKEIFNSVQTNGLLIDKSWIDFFVKNKFYASVSFDGPARFHNKTRVDFHGNGSFDKTLKNILALKEANVLSGIICCISQINASYPEEILDFFVESGIKKIKFLQVQGRDANGRLLPFSINSEQYADFIIAIFKKWIAVDNPAIEIREVKSIMNSMFGGEAKECTFAGECYKYFTVYPDGSIYGCDSLPKVESLRFGHITDGLNQIEKSPAFIKFRERTLQLKKKCQLCEWFNICHGGCLQDWWPDISEDQTKNLFCGGLKRIFNSIYGELKKYKLV